MVNLKIDLKGSGVDLNKSSGFEPYEGPLPRPGVYAATIRSCKIRISQAGNPYFNILFEFGNQNKEEKQAYKNFPLWDKIVPGDSDIQKERVAKFLHAVSGKDPSNVNVAVTHDEVTDGGNVTKIGGKDPVGTRCRVTVNRSSYNGEPIVELRDLFPWPKDEAWPQGDADVEDEDVEVEDEDVVEEEEPEEEEEEEEVEAEEEEEEEEDDGEFEARTAELEALDRTQTKAILKGLDPEFKMLKKHSDEDLRNAILDIEFPTSEEDGDDDPPF